jgi:flagellar motor switch protein FliN/FliY
MPAQPVYEQPMYNQPPPAAMQSQVPNQGYANMPMGQGYNEPHHLGGIAGRNTNVQPVQFSNLSSPAYGQVDENNLNLLMDIPLKVTVELGRTQKQIKDILELSQGSIIELDKLAGEPVDILVNNKLIAKGEVVVIDENFGVRVTDIVSQWDRIQKLQ